MLVSTKLRRVRGVPRCQSVAPRYGKLAAGCPANGDVHRGLAQVPGAQREAHHALLAGAQVNTLEAAQVADGCISPVSATDVKLHHFIAFALQGRGLIEALYADISRAGRADILIRNLDDPP